MNLPPDLKMSSIYQSVKTRLYFIATTDVSDTLYSQRYVGTQTFWEGIPGTLLQYIMGIFPSRNPDICRSVFYIGFIFLWFFSCMFKSFRGLLGN